MGKDFPDYDLSNRPSGRFTAYDDCPSGYEINKYKKSLKQSHNYYQKRADSGELSKYMQERTESRLQDLSTYLIDYDDY